MQAYQAIEMHEKAAAVAQGLTVFLRIAKQVTSFSLTIKTGGPSCSGELGSKAGVVSPPDLTF
jgi:hypothetical protein